MVRAEVIVVGGGPAGSTCAWKLKQLGIDALILDKKPFPRLKLCAGWIQPEVISDLEIEIDDYPHRIVRFDRFRVHIKNKNLKIPVNQYAIRRIEFDEWLLQRSGADVHTHEVKNIEQRGEFYVIDEKFECRYLVGAGGTYCPVYRTFFKEKKPRRKNLMIASLEHEFAYDYQDENCHLWFVQNNLPGYSWYVPKGNGVLNLGVGGYAEKIKANRDTIKNQWEFFVKELKKLNLVQKVDFEPKGYVYFLRDDNDFVQNGRAYVIGDAAGLATRDMGEGIGPAVRSGILAAESIVQKKPFSLKRIKKNSFSKPGMLYKLGRAYLLRSYD
ncbi:MAG: NAD(P)/FAD-dependent oxidoreductase [Calditrichaeota bacterium]|nr:NAD(P)/FAD-dependent oxidoreductase [Calditrichota bacterium]